MSDEADMEKNVAPDDEAMALPMSVLPVPGGPNNNMPLGTALRPVNNSGRCIGQMTISWILRFASARPATSSKVTGEPLSMTSCSILLTSSLSQPLRRSGSSSSSSFFYSCFFTNQTIEKYNLM